MWVWWRVGSPGFINIRTGSGRGQRKTQEIHPNVAELPPAQTLRGEQNGKHARVSPMMSYRAWICRGHAEGAEVTEGRGEGREDADVHWRREARWEEIQHAIVWREGTGLGQRVRQLSTIHQSKLW